GGKRTAWRREHACRRSKTSPSTSPRRLTRKNLSRRDGGCYTRQGEAHRPRRRRLPKDFRSGEGITMSPLFSFLPNLGTGEIIVLLILGVLLFGRKLPDVGRYLGKGIVEFKKGIKGIEDDVEGSHPASNQPVSAPAEPPRPPQKIA